MYAGRSNGGSPRWRRRPSRLAPALLTAALLGGACGGGHVKRSAVVQPGWKERGVASWYGKPYHGRRTANGEVYDMHALTAAHRTLPFDTLVEVRNLDNGRRVTVRINDRGPFIAGRVIDLSLTAAKKLDMVGPGTARVELTVLRDERKGRWAVQAGAFRDRQRAQGIADALGGRYPQVRVDSAGGWHRVQVGAFGERREADALRRALAADGYEAIVVRLR